MPSASLLASNSSSNCPSTSNNIINSTSSNNSSNLSSVLASVVASNSYSFSSASTNSSNNSGGVSSLFATPIVMTTTNLLPITGTNSSNNNSIWATLPTNTILDECGDRLFHSDDADSSLHSILNSFECSAVAMNSASSNADPGASNTGSVTVDCSNDTCDSSNSNTLSTILSSAVNSITELGGDDAANDLLNSFLIETSPPATSCRDQLTPAHTPAPHLYKTGQSWNYCIQRSLLIKYRT